MYASASGTASISSSTMATNGIDTIRDLAASNPGDLLPLKNLGYMFALKKIGQGTTYPHATNILTVSLVSTAELRGSDSSSLVLAFSTSGNELVVRPVLDEAPIDGGVVQATYGNGS